MNDFTKALLDSKLAPTAVRVATVVGSIQFTINHSSALAKGKMTKTR